jgi:cytochrome c-type biogenesis protein CcmE
MSKGVQIAGGATVIALLFAWYGASNLEGIAYYQTLVDFQAVAQSKIGKATRVHGYVEPGSIDRDVAGKRVRFAVQNDPPHAGGGAGVSLAVVYAGLETPDLFRDGAEVVVEGRLAGHDGDTVFQASKVMAKCPSKFEGELTQPSSS